MLCQEVEFDRCVAFEEGISRWKRLLSRYRLIAAKKNEAKVKHPTTVAKQTEAIRSDNLLVVLVAWLSIKDVVLVPSCPDFLAALAWRLRLCHHPVAHVRSLGYPSSTPGSMHEHRMPCSFGIC